MNPVTLRAVRWMLWVGLVTACAAKAELPFPADAVVFGDAAKGAGNDEDSSGQESGLSQALVFHDERQLHGKLVSIGTDDVVWQRPDASEPLHIPRRDILRIALRKSPLPASNPALARFLPVQQEANFVHATVKLSGSDWLFGDVTSVDGQTFTLKLSEKTSFTLDRSVMAWLQFDQTPAPAFGFSPGGIETAAWSGPGSFRPPTNDEGVLRWINWIGRKFGLPPRFEVDFQVPKGSETSTTLWLQTFGVGASGATSDAVSIRLGSDGAIRLGDGDEFHSTPFFLPRDRTRQVPLASYRIFCDAPNDRIVVVRNERVLADWCYREALRDTTPIFSNRLTRDKIRRPFQSIDFSGGEKGDFALADLRVRPWNGLIPGPGEAPPQDDRFSTASGVPIAGKLESISASEFSFSGKPQPIALETFVEFPSEPRAIEKSEAMLRFGPGGELSVANLRAEDGQVSCRAGIAEALKIAVPEIRTISFPVEIPVPHPANAILVFRNGDELPGHLAAWDGGHTVRWQMPDGAEVTFQDLYVAGIRFPGERNSGGKASDSLVELRNGDRLRLPSHDIVLTGIDLRIATQELGERTIPRQEICKLFGPSASKSEGIASPRDLDSSGVPTREWLPFDGRFVALDRGVRPSLCREPVLEMAPESWPDRYEWRIDLVNPGGGVPNFSLMLCSRDEALKTLLVSDQMGLCVNCICNGFRSGPVVELVPLHEKMNQTGARLSLRIFVDKTRRTMAFFLDGKLVTEVGRNPDQKLPPLDLVHQIKASLTNGYPVIVSGASILPWDGDLDIAHKGAAGRTLLRNGDLLDPPKEIRSGICVTEGDLGRLELPIEKVDVVEFGGAGPQPVAPFHLRLLDGSVVHLDHCRLDGAAVAGQSSVFGEIKITVRAIAELVFASEPPKIAGRPEVSHDIVKKGEAAP